MKKDYFIDNISDETLANLIDGVIKMEKTGNTKKDINIRTNIIKIVSVAAALVLFIGFLNFLPKLMNFNDDINPANSGEITSGENIDKSETDQSDLFIPDAMEKSFFEEKILNGISNKSAVNKILAYYTLRDPLYVLSPNTSAREKNQLLDYLREYTDITYNEMMQMCNDNNITLPKEIAPEYSHVRFGETEDILLLDIEWYTYETYLEFLEENKRDYEESKKGDFYLSLSDEDKKDYDNKFETLFKFYEEELDDIKNLRIYRSRLINGKFDDSIKFGDVDKELIDISESLDSNGYFILNIYPYYAWVIYYDENGIYQQKHFNSMDGVHPWILSLSEYEYILKNEIIPFCDDLLARGLLVQEEYDIYTIKNPLDYYIKKYFE